MLKRSRALASVAIIAVVTGMGAPVWAETLRDAIVLAYQTNPSLLAQRANQRALDESVVQARAGLRPSLDVTISGSHTQSYGDLAGFDGDSASASIGLSQTLWSGGRIGWNIVTSLNDIEAHNMGRDAVIEHDARYDRADEFMEVVLGHWDTWEDGSWEHSVDLLDLVPGLAQRCTEHAL